MAKPIFFLSIGMLVILTTFHSCTTEATLSKAEVETAEVTNITEATAICGGLIKSNGGSKVSERGICLSTSPTPTIENVKYCDTTNNEQYRSLLVGLTPQTTYYVRAFATNGVGTSYGSQISFTTKTFTIETTPVLFLSATSAICGGIVKTDGDSASLTVNQRGVCWNDFPSPTIDNSKLSSGRGAGSFTCLINELKPFKTYFARSFATNSNGTLYGNEISFTTLNGIIDLSTTTIKSITSTSAIIGGIITFDGGDSIISKGVCWSTMMNPTNDQPTTLFDKEYSGQFSFTISNLMSATTFFVRAFATNKIGTTYGDQQTFTTLSAIPDILTSVISNISGTTASCGGVVNNDGGAAIMARGVCWDMNPNPTVSLSTKTIDNNSIGTFTSTLSGLKPNTKYYVRAYATNKDGTAYGIERTFSTLSTPPIVGTYGIDNIYYGSATCVANVSSDGGSSVTSRGVCWNTKNNPTITTSSKTIDGSGLGSFQSSITGLSAKTTYYVRAYATNNLGTAYGQELSFTTAHGIVVHINTINNIKGISASCSSDIYSHGGAEINTRGICWSTSSNPTSYLPTKTDNGSGSGTFTSSLVGLKSNTTYYVRSYAISGNDTIYSSNKSFTTITVVPSVTTNSVKDITRSSAICDYSIISDGGATVTSRGIIWRSTTINQLTSSEGGGIGTFTYLLTGLSPGITYYVNAYATNSIGTTNGNQIEFKTLPEIPTVTTNPLSKIFSKSATGGGAIINDGGAAISKCGLFWSTTPNPNLRSDGSGDGVLHNGVFVSSITDLNANTTYYVCAYATNSAGTGYGQQVSFTTINTSGRFTDLRDGNVYNWVEYNNKIWMVDNLSYIPKDVYGSDGNGNYYYEYGCKTKEQAYISNNQAKYGILYNYDAAKKSCPTGWHLPSFGEWTEMQDYIKNYGYFSKFSQQPAGAATLDGVSFYGLGSKSYWWSTYHMYWYLKFNSPELVSSDVVTANDCFSVRCIKD